MKLKLNNTKSNVIKIHTHSLTHTILLLLHNTSIYTYIDTLNEYINLRLCSLH